MKKSSSAEDEGDPSLQMRYPQYVEPDGIIEKIPWNFFVAVLSCFMFLPTGVAAVYCYIRARKAGNFSLTGMDLHRLSAFYSTVSMLFGMMFWGVVGYIVKQQI